MHSNGGEAPPSASQEEGHGSDNNTTKHHKNGGKVGKANKHKKGASSEADANAPQVPLFEENRKRLHRMQRQYRANQERLPISTSVFTGPCEFVTSCNSIEAIERSVDLRHRRQRAQHTMAEVCFVGRSNVGKSSLINALVARDDLVKTSKTPGRTQTLNYFYLQDGFYLVDVPGYGYASAPVVIVREWKKVMEEFLLNRSFTPLYKSLSKQSITENSPPLQMVYLLLDSRRDGLKTSDRDFVFFLEKNQIPYTVIMTKSDKIPKRSVRENGNLLLEEIRDIRLEMGQKGDEMPLLLVTSASEESNIDQLRMHITLHACNMRVSQQHSTVQKGSQVENMERTQAQHSAVAEDRVLEKAPRRKKLKSTAGKPTKIQKRQYVFKTHIVDDRSLRTKDQKKMMKRILKARKKAATPR